MILSGLSVLTTIGPTAFAILAWGTIFLVLIAFGYVIWSLVLHR